MVVEDSKQFAIQNFHDTGANRNVASCIRWAASALVLMLTKLHGGQG
jgi:hypothetical protein